MENETIYDNYDIGVVIGRFQIDELHESHKKLFDYVTERHEKVICLLGLGHLKSTKRNPLDFQQRKQMLSEDYPNLICLYVKDMPSDIAWSKKVDEIIGDNLMPNQKALMYGSRDSFIKHYKGRFDTHELESDSFVSATVMRQKITRSIHASKEFRMGVVWGASNRFPTNYVTVDIAIMDKNRTKILLARKPNEDKYRFVGGFSDPTSETLEADAIREVKEETNCDITYPEYICSQRIDDWRYAGEEDSICTTFFIADYESGSPTAQDDIEEIRWFDITDFIWEDGYAPIDNSILKNSDKLVRGHVPLMLKLVDFLKK